MFMINWKEICLFQGLFLFFCSSLAGCFEDLEAESPAYLHIKTPQLQVSNGQGAATFDITNLRVYQENEDLGYYPYPKTIPLIKHGKQEMTIISAVKKTGQENRRIQYPFYSSFKASLDINSLETDTIEPIFSYKPGLLFLWLEDFEDGTISLQARPNSQQNYDSAFITSNKTDLISLGNNKSCLKLELPPNSTWDQITLDDFGVKKGTPIYLEIDYNTTSTLWVSLRSNNGLPNNIIQLIQLFPTNNKWKKIYINLSDDLNQISYSSSTYNIFFTAVNGSSTNTQTILIDNLKLITVE